MTHEEVGRRLLIVGVWALVALRVAAEFTDRGGRFWHYDLRLLFNEQSAFYGGQYPHEGVVPTPAGTTPVRSDYPPSSFLLAVPWVPPGLTWGATRAWFTLCQVIAAGLLVWFVVRMAHGESSGLGWLLAGGVLAMTGLRADLLFGNYALLMAGALVILYIATERPRSLLAAGALTEAMLKPQMGWLFALIFLHRRGWKVLLGAGVALALSTSVALAWTHVSPLQLLRSRYSENLTEISTLLERHSLVTVLVQFGVAPEHALVLAALIGIVWAAWALHAWLREAGLLTRFAFVALVNRISTYHNTCDDLLLVFALALLGRRAWREGGAGAWAEFLILGVTVWAPSLWLQLPGTKLAVIGAWMAIAAAICVRAAHVPRHA